MLYLKNLGESDSVTVTILDDANSQIVQTYEITEDHTSLTWENVENNKSNKPSRNRITYCLTGSLIGYCSEQW